LLNARPAGIPSLAGHPGSGTRGGSHLEPRELLLGAAAATYAIGHSIGVAVEG